MKYSYTHLDDFFKLTTWDEDIKGPFGLQPPPGDWASFKGRIDELNASCPPGESVRVIYAARHGQAEHNILGEKYNMQIDEAQIKYPILDPALTPLGRSQAAAVSQALQREIGRGMPKPQKWFTSPLLRPGETVGIEWGWMFGGVTEGDRGGGVPAVVVENLREHLHVHECDARSPLAKLKPLFPSFIYSPDMTDEDALWQPGSVRGRETEEELVERLGRAAEECLDKSAGATYLSFTAHSGALRGLHAALGVPFQEMDVGEMKVIVLRVKEVA
ncbi:hypothetical protein EHS25_008046 [Saitozyma podzolica]|uniref:Phosphoglycerate mutase n=1 Tax=Saitozyma podzolica TaxID=1890683 RepID=A0A427YNG2_9TREE|nr:hypothetical protein EHS25_008046 [Saitozyma podzolica]